MKFDKTGLEAYVTDRTVEAEVGVWLTFPGGRKFQCLRAGGSNARFKRRLDQLIAPYQRQIQRGTLDPEIDARIMRQVFAETVVVDWTGVKDDEGKAVPYTAAVGEEYFQAFPELFEDLKALCTVAATFQEDQLEEAKTRLGKPLSGRSNTGKF